MSNNPLIALGPSQLWSYVPITDLPTILPQNDRKITIVFLACSDPLYILYTLSILSTHSPQNVTMHLIEPQIEPLARLLILTQIALFSPDLSAEKCIEIFLEIYGNKLLQKQTEIQLKQICQKSMKYISSYQDSLLDDSIKLDNPFQNLFDLSSLKSKSLDTLYNTLDYIFSNTEFNAKSLRDARLRGYFGDRYDSRSNLVDWDYHMHLPKTILGIYHYKKWRLSGQAYEERNCLYEKANKTLTSHQAASMRKRGSVLVRGFWTDTLISPYISIGIKTENVKLFEKMNNQYVNTSVDVAKWNLKKIIEQIRIGPKWSVQKDSGVENKHPEHLSEKTNSKNIEDTTKSADFDDTATQICPNMLNLVKIKLHHGTLESFLTKYSFRNNCDHWVMSQSQISSLTEVNWRLLLSENAIVSIDTIEYFPLTADEKAAFRMNLKELGLKAGLRVWEEPKEGDSFVTFTNARQ